MPELLTHRGAILRRWRESKNLTQAAIGRIAVPEPVLHTTVSQWESGRSSGLDLPTVRAIDARFSAAGCFTDICAAAGTPQGLDPDTDWFHNFQGPSGPCWGWARTPGPKPVAAFVDAGPFRLEFEVPPGDGVFIQAHAFASNPAVTVHLGEPGWVDFGMGVVPTDLGVPVVPAIDFAIMGPAAVSDPALSAAYRHLLKDRFGADAGWFERFKATAGRRVEVARRFLTQSARATVSAASDLTAAQRAEDVEQGWGGPAYARLREARGLTQADAVREVSDLEVDQALAAGANGGRSVSAPISDDQLSRFEAGRSPRVPQLRERLDMVYRADGRTCFPPVTVRASGQGRFEAVFPSYWIGPVWVRFTPPAGVELTAVVRAVLVWKPWRKTLKLNHDVVVTCRRSDLESDPLIVDAPAGWAVSAGVGAHPCAVDVNEGWGFVDPQSGREALTNYYNILMAAMRGGTKDADR